MHGNTGHLFEPIPVDDFKEHVKSLHRNDDYPFSEEYSVSMSIDGAYHPKLIMICTEC